MKLALATLLTLASLAAWADPDLTQTVSLRLKNVSPTAAFKELTTKTGVKFVIDPAVKFKKSISIEVKDAKLKDVLEFIVADQKLTWNPGVENQVLITVHQ